MKRQRRRDGDIICIPLSEDRKAYAMILRAGDIFFDYFTRGDDPLPIKDIIKHPVLFQIGVVDYAVTKGIWKVIGHVEPPPELLVPPKYFIQSSMSGALFITSDGSDRRPATYEECKNLECCAAWDPEHVVSRLEDYLEGKPNRWVELVRPKRITT